MKHLALIPALALLAACGGQERQAVFTCPNGPDLAVTYTEDSATLNFSNGRVEVLPRTSVDSEVYAKPGMAWRETTFREGRLDNEGTSYRCDEFDL